MCANHHCYNFPNPGNEYCTECGEPCLPLQAEQKEDCVRWCDNTTGFIYAVLGVFLGIFLCAIGQYSIGTIVMLACFFLAYCVATCWKNKTEEYHDEAIVENDHAEALEIDKGINAERQYFMDNPVYISCSACHTRSRIYRKLPLGHYWICGECGSRIG
jgi:hypothetical protein